MAKRGILLGLFAILLISFVVSAETITLTNVNSTLATVSVSNADKMYGYELNFDFTGIIGNVVFYNFLAGNGATTTAGSTNTSNVLTVYESRLDNTKTGISGSGNLFNITYSGTISKNSFLGLDNSSNDAPAETSVNYLCGNGVCAGTETCSTCSTDCGACPVSQASGGGSINQARIIYAKKLVEDVKLSSDELIFSLQLNSKKERIISVVNEGNTAKKINIVQEGLDNILYLEEYSIELGAGERREIRVLFMSPDITGIYTGKIYIAGKEVFVSVNVVSQNLLFDSSIVIPDANKKVKRGENLATQVSLISIGKQRASVRVNYVIKDYSGKIYMEEEEIVDVEQQINYGKEFSTQNLPAGDYIAGIEVAYLGGVSTSSSRFHVLEGGGNQVFWIVLILGVSALALAALYFISRKPHLKKYSSRNGR